MNEESLHGAGSKLLPLSWELHVGQGLQCHATGLSAFDRQAAEANQDLVVPRKQPM